MTQLPADGDAEELRQTARRNRRIHTVLQATTVGGSLLTVSLISAGTSDHLWFRWAALGAALAVSFAAGISIIYKFRDRSFMLVQVADTIQQARQRLDEAEKRVEEEPHARVDFVSLWSVTQKRLDYYHEIATEQARSSYRKAQTAMTIGFAVILAAAGFAAWSTTVTGAISTGVVGIAGGALGGYIGRTFLKAQEDATTQLRSYFDQPMRFSWLLAAERLVEQVPETERAKLIRRLFVAVVEAKHNSSSTGSGKRAHPDPN